MQQTDNKISSKELLKQIETINNFSEKNKNFNLVLQHGEDNLKKISSFYGCDQFESLLLAVIIYKHIQEKLINNRTLASTIGIPFIEMAEMVQTLKKFTKTDFITYRCDKEHGVKYSLHKRILSATYAGKMIENKKKREDKTFDFLKRIRNQSEDRFNGDILTCELFQSASEELEQNGDLPFVKWLKKWQLSTEEILFLTNACYEYITDDPDISVDLLVKVMFDDEYDRYIFKKELIDEKSALFLNNLITWPKGNLNNNSEIMLNDTTISALLSNDLGEKLKPITSTFLDIFYPEKIPCEKLVYNSKEEKVLAILKNSLQEEGYKLMLSHLKENNLKPGLTILFHGHPGTGKTSTVMQIAKDTQRLLLRVDASRIKSMWVGESEKSTRKIFDEYRRIAKSSPRKPILLFDEADAVFSNRIKVTHSVDQTMNTIQNILLQELSDFEGIFVATTNLTGNLDQAFERRFLYKICFEKPSAKIQSVLLRDNFPEIPAEDLVEITNELELTGSQIQNIKKKLQIKQVFEKQVISAATIKEMASEEFINANQRCSIGFKKT